MLPAKFAILVAVVLAVSSAVFFQQNAQQTPKSTPMKIVSVNDLFDDDRAKAFKAPIPGTYKLPIIKPAGDGELLDINSKPVTLSAITKGKISIISFIYTACSETKGCPYSMSTLFDVFHVSEKVAGIADHVVFTTISFDPVRDTPKAMAAYGTAALADKNRARKIPWHFLTARDEKSLQPILDAYGQAINRQSGSDTIDHLLRLYLVDRNGQIRNIYGLGFMDPRLLYADIFTLMLEDGTIKNSGV